MSVDLHLAARTIAQSLRGGPWGGAEKLQEKLERKVRKVFRTFGSGMEKIV
jgi:hypothetical protein